MYNLSNEEIELLKLVYANGGTCRLEDAKLPYGLSYTKLRINNLLKESNTILTLTERGKDLVKNLKNDE